MPSAGQMRVAILTDIHGNLTAFEAVLADLRETSPDLILHGGDLADSGSGPCEIVDQIRDLGWPGVYGNTDEMLFDPASLEEFACNPPRMPALFEAIREMAAWTRDKLRDERIAWLRSLARTHIEAPVALLHASLASVWRAPSQTATETELDSVYSSLGQPVVIYGHIHQPYVRSIPGSTIVNAGSVGMPYDGDPRASYVLIDGSVPQIRRVEYDVEREIRRLANSGMPHADWVMRTLQTAAPQMP